MANSGEKTPVSLLLEYLVSKRIIPKFELIHNGVGTHNPKFTYQVQVGTVKEEGTGRSKQEAKHRAAGKMLKSLQIIPPKAEEEEANDSLVDSTENYVGQLKELCIILHYPEPKYLLEEAAGPPHSRVFKMICNVSTLQDFGISRTKKQAKHKAAFKMLQRLKLGGEKIEKALLHAESLMKIPGKTQLMSDEEIKDKYFALRSASNSSYKDPTVFYKDHSVAYLRLQETSSTLSEILNKNNVAVCKSSLNLIQKIAKELEVALSTTVIPSKKSLTYTIMSMSVYPAVAAVGIDDEDAAFNLLNSLMVLCNS